MQTAACLTAALGTPTLPLQVDEALCEEEPYLRPRMMGTHRASVAAAARTAVVSPTGETPRGVCMPVLLRPGDLLSIHRHVDLKYRGDACLVEHDAVTGAELNALTRLPQTSDERAQQIVAAIERMAPVGRTTVLCTHGAFANRLGRLLLAKDAWPNFAYAEVAELECDGDDCGAGKWRVVGRWAPAGDAGRSKNA